MKICRGGQVDLTNGCLAEAKVMAGLEILLLLVHVINDESFMTYEFGRKFTMELLDTNFFSGIMESYNVRYIVEVLLGYIPN